MTQRMERIRVVVNLPLNAQQKERLEAEAPEADFHYCTDNHIPKQMLEEAEVWIGNFTPAQALEAKNMRLLQLASAGANAFCKPGVLSADTMLANASGAYGISVSEHMAAGTFALAKNLYAYYENQGRHLWKDEGEVLALEQAVVLILGTGDLGSCYAKRMKALGSYTIGICRKKRQALEFFDELHTLDSLDTCIPKADILALCLPSTPDTVHIINASRLSMMKPTAFLVNGGRGDAIDLEALYEAAVKKTIKGAFLDVTDPEPLPAEHPLWDVPGVVITPHVAGGFHIKLTLDFVVSIAARNLSHYMKGEPLENLVDRKQGY